MKVLFFTNIPSPYRVDFFNELGKHCDLTVLYERHDADDRASSWLKGTENLHFKAVFLKGRKIGADTALCFSACKYWKDKSYDLRIVGDYASPTGMLSIAYMRLKGIPYGFGGVASLAIKRGSGNHVLTATWKVPSSLSKGTKKADKADKLKVTWTLAIPGKDPKKVEIIKKLSDHNSAVNLSNFNAGIHAILPGTAADYGISTVTSTAIHSLQSAGAARSLNAKTFNGKLDITFAGKQ